MASHSFVTSSHPHFLVHTHSAEVESCQPLKCHQTASIFLDVATSEGDEEEKFDKSDSVQQVSAEPILPAGQVLYAQQIEQVMN